MRFSRSHRHSPNQIGSFEIASPAGVRHGRIRDNAERLSQAGFHRAKCSAHALSDSCTTSKDRDRCVIAYSCKTRSLNFLLTCTWYSLNIQTAVSLLSVHTVICATYCCHFSAVIPSRSQRLLTPTTHPLPHFQRPKPLCARVTSLQSRLPHTRCVACDAYNNIYTIFLASNPARTPTTVLRRRAMRAAGNLASLRFDSKLLGLADLPQLPTLHQHRGIGTPLAHRCATCAFCLQET